jgi:hypothetical protein
MQWMLITLETLVTGVLAIILSLVVLFAGLSAYSRYVFGQVSDVFGNLASR